MRDQTASECPKMLAQVMELCNLIPDPYIWPPGYYQHLEKDEEPNWRIPKRPIEARLLHAEVIKAEVLYGFNVEFAVQLDPSWAKRFERAFYTEVGNFKFVGGSAEKLFNSFRIKHGRKTWEEMDESLEKYMYEELGHVRNRDLTLREEMVRRLSYAAILTDRINRLNPSDELLAYINFEILPYSGDKDIREDNTEVVNRLWRRDQRVKDRWIDLWNCYYNLGTVSVLNDPDSRGFAYVDSRLGHGRHMLIYVDNDGMVRTHGDLFAQIIMKNDIEAARVKTCPECKVFFWGKRVDAKCCSEKCSNAYSVRKFRRKKKSKPLTDAQMGEALDSIDGKFKDLAKNINQRLKTAS